MSCSEWKTVRIEEICDVGSSKRIFASEYKDSGIPFYRSKEIIELADNKYIATELFISNEKFDEIDKKFGSPKRGDILLSSIGANMGIPYYVNSDKKFYFKDGNVTWFKNFKENVNSKYLYFLIKSEYIQTIFTNIAIGSAQKALTIDSLKKIEINLPPLEVQEKIVDILSSLDNKIELNNEMNKTLEEMAQSIFKRWFVDFEFPNEDGEPYKSSGGEMVESELGMIPKGWEVNKLGDVVNIITKSEKPFNNESILYEHFSIPAFDNNKLPVFEYGKNISSNKYIIDNHCILMSKLNPDNKRIWNPNCTTDKSICSTEFMVYKPISKDKKSFIYEILNNERFTEFLISNATGSTGSRQRVKPKDTLEYSIVIPNQDIIKCFISIINPIHNKIQLNIQNIKDLNGLRSTLLPKLVNGDLKI